MFQVVYVDVQQVVYVVGQCMVGYYFILVLNVVYEVVDGGLVVFFQLYVYEGLQVQVQLLWFQVCIIVDDYVFVFELLQVVQVG